VILYHASPRTLPVGECLRTPTGASCMDVTAGGVVYLTDTPDACERYGTVYEIEVAGAVSYAEQRRRQGLPVKKSRYTRGVWVALPERTIIRRKV
jgi:hypothetical protein